VSIGVTAAVAFLAVLAWSVAWGGEIVDLTHPFDDETIYWPTSKRFELQVVSHGPTDAGFWYEANQFCAAEHGGTHIDAPCHFAEGRRTVDQIPLEQLIGPAAVIDVREACAQDADYRVRVSDIRRHEEVHGRLPDGAIVLFWTGWGERWPDVRRYLGDDRPGEATDLHFPGISREAATFLVQERRVDAVGLDTASLDHGPSKDFIAHQILNGANIPGLENVAHLDRLPPRGATVYAMPVKIGGGSGAPARVFATLPDEDDDGGSPQQ
jgi:kynurenine formamidase